MFAVYLKVRDFWNSIFNLLFVLLVDILTLPYRMKRTFRGEGRIHVLGNGPTLRNDYERLKKNIKNGDSVLCVNGFAISELFSVIRPNVYMLVDSAFFEEKDLVESSKRMVNETIRVFTEVIDWDMALIVPFNRQKSKRLDLIRKNKHIRIYPIMNIPVVGGFIGLNATFFYLKMATPCYQNVLNASAYFAVLSGFKDIRLWGSDHDWLEERTVLNDNKMYEHNKHFYGKKEGYFIPFNTTVHYQMECFDRCFRAYHEIAKYADMKGSKITNMASKSWIDAFERG